MRYLRVPFTASAKSSFTVLRDVKRKQIDSAIDFIVNSLAEDSNAEIEILIDGTSSEPRSIEEIRQLSTIFHEVRCQMNGLPPISSLIKSYRYDPERIQKYNDFINEFVERVEMGDFEHQRRLTLRRKLDPEEPSTYVDPVVVKLQNG